MGVLYILVNVLYNISSVRAKFVRTVIDMFIFVNKFFIFLICVTLLYMYILHMNLKEA